MLLCPLCAQVTRSKTKWKVQLKQCLVTMNGRDYVLGKASGEMNF
jgi:hypothetical protein